jgi:predicted amidohydrolase
MRLALAQRRAAALSPEENLARGLEAVGLAREQGADLVVFPELWQIGYAACPEEPAARAAWLRLAVAIDDPWLGRFRDEAARLRLAMVVTFLHRRDGGPASAAAVIGADGAVVFVQGKVHACDFSWEAVLTPGEEFRTGTVLTRAGRVELGVMICFDREFPESARVLTLAGAELIVCPNACLLCDDRIGQLRARAFENMTAVALANYPMPTMNGRSCVFDGIATERGRPRDHCLAMAGPRAGLICADIDLAALRSYRSGGLWSAARRQPAAYQSLVTGGKG